MFGGKKSKAARKKILSSLVVLLLVGGLLLSATMGFFDFLWGKENTVSFTDDEYISALKKQAGLLEQTLETNPGDLEKQADLGNIYYELAMYYLNRGSEEKEVYAVKSRESFLKAVKGGLRKPFVTLRIALLSAFIQDDEHLAEKYFKDTLELQDDYTEAHFYYGIFLLSREREEEARHHWEKALQFVEQGSPLEAEIQHYLQIYAEADISGKK